MGLKIDLHVHTYYSHDSSISFKDIVYFTKKRGLDGVAITDHNTMKGALKIKTCEIIIIPGIEVTTLEGHLLGINVTEVIPSHTGMEEAIERIHGMGGIAVAPHPTSFYRSPPSRKVTSYDAVEVMNAASVPFSVFTYLSKRYAESFNYPQVGGSDSHYAPEIGSAYTVVDANSDIEEIVTAIKKGEVFPQGHGIILKNRLKRTAISLKKKV